MKRWVSIGAVSMAIAVGLGAFGTHALKDRFDEKQLGWWMTAQQYQIWHALGLILLGILAARLNKPLNAPGWLFVAGTLLFSVSLYVMALTGMTWLGAVTPLGGAAFITGWLLLAFSIKKASTDSDEL